MSYKTWCMNSKGEYHQIFGNNVYPFDFVELVKKYGEVDDEACYDDIIISDIDAVVKTMIKFIRETENNFNDLHVFNKKELRSIYDLTDNFTEDTSFYHDNITRIINWAYLFIVYNFIEHIKHDIRIYHVWENDTIYEKYELKEGREIVFSAG